MTYQEDEYLLLSGIQHFSFCRRQWALIHIENLWAENELTAGGRVVHERVHEKMRTESRGDELTVCGLPVRSSTLGISGECDAVVFTHSPNGIKLHGRKGLWSVMPVEYKHGHSKIDDCDRLQSAAQAMCLEEMFCCRIDRAALYYHETRSREYIDVDDSLREAVTNAFAEMHELFRRGYTPAVRRSSRCARCSLKDQCVPELGAKGSARLYIRNHMEDDV